jgi:hypothetical protein
MKIPLVLGDGLGTLDLGRLCPVHCRCQFGASPAGRPLFVPFDLEVVPPSSISSDLRPGSSLTFTSTAESSRVHVSMKAHRLLAPRALLMRSGSFGATAASGWRSLARASEQLPHRFVFHWAVRRC